MCSNIQEHFIMRKKKLLSYLYGQNWPYNNFQWDMLCPFISQLMWTHRLNMFCLTFIHCQPFKFMIVSSIFQQIIINSVFSLIKFSNIFILFYFFFLKFHWNNKYASIYSNINVDLTCSPNPSKYYFLLFFFFFLWYKENTRVKGFQE